MIRPDAEPLVLLEHHEFALADSQTTHGAVFTEEELGIELDELLSDVIEKPDDKVAMASLQMFFTRVYESGQIEQAMQVAVTVGAMACMHSHLQETANGMSSLFASQDEKHDENQHTHEHKKSETHDKNQCEDCKNGRKCSKK